jgi:hypothetical protein
MELELKLLYLISLPVMTDERQQEKQGCEDVGSAHYTGNLY